MYKSFFLDTANMTKPKLYTNGHWIVPFKIVVFHMDWKSKMANSTDFI